MIDIGVAPRVRVDLKPGLYLFESQSGTGKTYLCDVVKPLFDGGYPVFGYTYHDYLIGVKLGQAIRSRQIDLLVVDRFDQYMGAADVALAISRLALTAVVLVDVKSSIIPDMGVPGIAYVILSSGSIEVSS